MIDYEASIENRKSWIEALRSGDYEQNFFTGRHKDTYCALGVASDISGTGEWTVNELGYYIYNTDTSLEQWLALSIDELLDIASENDEGNDFNKVADYIEEAYL